jgi:hypothetical protein
MVSLSIPVITLRTLHGSVLAKEASRFLHFQVQDRVASTLLALPDQGKVGRALTTDTFANGSTWQYNGLNILSEIGVSFIELDLTASQ